MKILVLIVEIILVVWIIPDMGYRVWERRAAELVAEGDRALASDPERAYSLYCRAADLAHKDLEPSRNRIDVCNAYLIGTTRVPSEFGIGVNAEKKRKDVLAAACRSKDFARSLVAMPRLESEMEHRLWKDSEEMGVLHTQLISRVEMLATNDVVWAQKELASALKYGLFVKKDDEAAFRMFLRLAETGDHEAQREVAECYRTERGVSSNAVEMVKWYLKVADDEDPNVELCLAECYENGWGVERNETVAQSWYGRSAEHGNVKACVWLATKCLSSKSDAEVEQGVAWLQKAVDLGDIPSMTRLGKMYHEGNVVVKRIPHKAVKLFTKAAEAGDVEAQYKLGVCYCNGEGVPVDEAKGIELIKKAAERGHMDAQRTLGDLYITGSCVKADALEAVSWYRKAASQGDLSAATQVGASYASGLGIEKDVAEAMRWLEKPAKAKIADAEITLGMLYMSEFPGDSLKAKKAAELLEHPAQEGDEYAQVALGDLYADGRGIEKDEVKAFDLYLEAANKGLATAQYKIGQCYFLGKGIKKNEGMAFRWFRRAAEQGDSWGEASLAVCYLTGAGVARDDELGCSWAKKSAEQGNPFGQYVVGECYEYGCGKRIAPNKYLALAWYRKAAKQEFPPAAEKIRELTSINTSNNKQK